MKNRLQIGIISVFVLLSVFFNQIFFVFAQSTDNEYDPFGTSGFGPDAPVVSVDGYSIPSSVTSIEKLQKQFKINTVINGIQMPFYITFPQIGGFRLYGENTGTFSPDGLDDIIYSADESGNIIMSGKDNMKVRFVKKGLAFYLYVYDNSKELFVLKSNQIKFGFSGGKLIKIKLEMPLLTDEVIYGSGERFGGLNQNGKRTIMWNMDCAYHGNSENAELWRGYKNVPILHSNKGYTLFYNSFCSATVDIGYTNKSIYSMDFCSDEFDVFFWAGASKETIQRYTDLTGKSVLPPKWAFRYIAGAGKSYWTKATTDAEAQNLRSVLQKYKDLGTSDISAIYLEGITETKDIFDICNNSNTRYLRWNSPDLSRENQEQLLSEYNSGDMPIVKESNGADSGSFIDFTHKNSSVLMNRWLAPSVSSGLFGGLIDFGELIQPTTVFSNGIGGEKMHNYFARFYAKGYNDAFANLKGNDDFVLFSRAGCAGMQSYSGCFSGDQAATFYGLKQQLSAGLSAGVSGFSAWGGDMAGYEGRPTNEVFCRGLELSAFYPFMRAHGTTTRMPWDFGEEGKATYKKYYWLRENLLDFIYSNAVKSSISGLPMMRPFVLEFPNEGLDEIDDSYIFCEDMLVAPVLTAGATSRNITFPGGNWYNLYTGERISGGKTESVPADITEIPVFLRAGTVMPVSLSKNLNFCESMENGDKENSLLVTPPDCDTAKDFYSSKQYSTQYRSFVSQNGYKISAQNGNKAKSVVALGTLADSVLIDGKRIKFESNCQNATAPCYYFDENGNTKIRIGTQNWSTVDIITENSQESLDNKVIWDFNSISECDSFDVYVNDSQIGLEKQTADYRLLCSDGILSVKAPLASNDGSNAHFWSGMSASLTAISPKLGNIKNFETEISFSSAKGAGATGAVLIGLREKSPGLCKKATDNWSYGNPNDKEKGFSALFGAVTENLVWGYNAGIQTSSKTLSDVNFMSGDFYTLKLRSVNNLLTVTVLNNKGETLFNETNRLYDNLNQEGYLSYYINGDCRIDSISLTRLDNFGKSVCLFDYGKEKEANINLFEKNNTVYLSGNTGFASAQCDLSFDAERLNVDEIRDEFDNKIILSENRLILPAELLLNGNWCCFKYSSDYKHFCNTKLSFKNIKVTRKDGTYFNVPDKEITLSLNENLLGDSNDDGYVNLLDLVRTKNYLAGKNVTVYFDQTDMNFDKKTDADDVLCLKKKLLSNQEDKNGKD